MGKKKICPKQKKNQKKTLPLLKTLAIIRNECKRTSNRAKLSPMDDTPKTRCLDLPWSQRLDVLLRFLFSVVNSDLIRLPNRTHTKKFKNVTIIKRHSLKSL